jgi:hypothetical protein
MNVDATYVSTQKMKKQQTYVSAYHYLNNGKIRNLKFLIVSNLREGVRINKNWLLKKKYGVF